MGRLSIFDYAEGATPLDLNEADGLIPKHITTQGQLNEWEQVNILEAEQWLQTKKNADLSEIMTVDFIKKLHIKMFSSTWRWAGDFRQSNKNIGVDWSSISVSLKILLDDVVYQTQHQTYSIDEWAARFHHRLVAIHVFANGNGRHARMMADVVLLSRGNERFSWGQTSDLTKASSIRQQYISALRAADKMDYQPLMNFVRAS